jgi:hypothetical protein
MADFVAETEEDIRNAIAEILKECEDEGMAFPVILCAISPNGSISANRIDGLGGTETLAEHVEDGVFTTPMTFIVLDQNNVAAHIRLNHGGQMTRH